MEKKMTTRADLKHLTVLGKKIKPSRKLETFPNHHPGRDYIVTMHTEEFTCVCPLTKQPDFAVITIQYTPDKLILESKSLKFYLQTYRHEGAFHEHVTNAILDDIVAAVSPRWCKITADFTVRGGIGIAVEAEYEKSPPHLTR